MHRIQAYVTLALMLIGGILLLYLPVLIRLRKRGISALRQLACLGLFCALFLIVFATLLFVPVTLLHRGARILNLTPFIWVGQGDELDRLVTEALPNLMLFVPLGFFLPAVFRGMRRLWRTAALSLGVTVGVELIQYFIGRSADIDDVIANLCGAAVGYGLFWAARRLFRRAGWWRRLVGDEGRQ